MDQNQKVYPLLCDFEVINTLRETTVAYSGEIRRPKSLPIWEVKVHWEGDEFDSVGAWSSVSIFLDNDE